MKTLYLLWLLSPGHSDLNTRGVWFDSIISCEITAMEVAADTGHNLKELSCVPSSIGGRES